MTATEAAAVLRVYLLGPFEVRLGERLVLDRAWSRRKAKALLKLLALQRGRSLHREQVLDALWPDLDPGAAANNLHKSLHYLRAALAEHGAPPAASLAGEMVALAPDVWIDIEEFRAAAQAARGSGDPATYEEALVLYRGDLLPEDLYEDWAEPQREELRSLRTRLLLELGQVYEARGQTDPAAERLQQLLHSDPLQEEAHRALMRLYARAGSRHRALRQYQQCRDALQRELGVEPSEETEALYREIQQREGPPTGAPAPAATPPPSPRRSRRRELPPLYGRERELEVAEGLLEAVASGRGQALFLGGVAGIGKSHLARQILAAAEELGALALAGRSYDLEVPVSYQPVRDMLGQLLEHEREQGADGPLGQVLRRSLYLKRLLPGTAHPDVTPVADPQLLQLELFNEIGHLFGTLASADRPLVLLFDDLHAADDASLRLVHFLCRHVPTQAVLLLAAYRTEESASTPALAQLIGSLKRERLVRELALAPLPERTMQLILAELFGRQPVERELAQHILRRADGNPLFAGELVHTAVEEGWVRFADGLWQRRGVGPAPVPEAVHDLLDRRLQRLGDAARQVLHVSAVLGRAVDYGLLRRVIPLSERDILDGLDEGLASFILEEVEDGYRYRHSLLREAIYRRLTRARRQQLHRTIAAALEQHGRADAETVGYHFAESDEPWRAVGYLQAAARRAASVFANQQAIELYERAIAIARDHSGAVGAAELASLLEALGDLVRRSGDAARSASVFGETTELLAASGDEEGVARVRGKAALGHIMLGDVQTAAELLGTTLHAMGEHSPRLATARTYYLLAQLRWHNGQYREAMEAAEKALLAAESSGDAAQRAQAYEVLALACHSLGDWHKGVEYALSHQSLVLAGVDTDGALDAFL